MRRLSIIFTTCLTVFLSIASPQQPPTPKSQVRIIRVGVAVPLNESKFVVTETLGRDQIISDLKALRKDRKSELTLEPISLRSWKKGDALQEAAEKHCDYVLLTRILDLSRTGSVLVGPTGVEPIPPMLGNVDPQKRMAVDFSVFRPGHPDEFAGGRTAVPTDSLATATPSGNSAFEEAANQVALRVAGELRRERPPQAD